MNHKRKVDKTKFKTTAIEKKNLLPKKVKLMSRHGEGEGLVPASSDVTS